nr:amidophosphoribosyltransferase [uncultured Methanoregula sp.]
MCGIVGIIDTKSVSIQLYYALYALQHRGQESAGISTFEDTMPHKFKSSGLVADAFSPEILSDLKGYVGIGHVRYTTPKGNIRENIQPLNFQFQDHFLSIALNGGLINRDELRSEYERTGQIFTTTSDAEIIAHILINEINTTGNVEDAVRRCMRKIQGSYSVVAMIDGILYGFRDPLGIKPFCIGKTASGYIIASESIALDANNAVFIRHVSPGELIRVDLEGIRSTQIAIADRKAHCIHEYIYFSRVDSNLDGVSAYKFRLEVGKKLCEEAPVIADFVCSIPNGGNTFAIGYAEQSKIPYGEAMIRNPYLMRNVNSPSQREREMVIQSIFNLFPSHLKDKSIILIDDSIVRGTVAKKLIKMMYDNGAREIHMRIGCPAIKVSCHLGGDMPNQEDLIASCRNEEEVRQTIGATTLRYISIEKLNECLRVQYNNLCTGCLTGIFPIANVSEVKSEQPKIKYLDNSFQSNFDQFSSKDFQAEK